MTTGSRAAAAAAVVAALAACRGRSDPAERDRPTQVGDLTRAATREAEVTAPRRIDPDVPAAAVEQGHAAIGRLKKELTTALTAALADGPAPAIAVCNHDAPLIAARVGGEGVRLGRATRRARNPANLAGGWQADALSFFESVVAGGGSLDGAAYAVALPDRTAYAEPLVAAPLCLTCHGTDLVPEVTAALAERYPSDRATGYRAGDLRGIAWVELPGGR